MKPRVGIIGDGNVGSALRRGLERAGYDVRAVGKAPGQVKETGQWADVVMLAVPSARSMTQSQSSETRSPERRWWMSQTL